MSTAVIFGGSGFIGCFFASHLIKNMGYSLVYLVDLDSVEQKPHKFRRHLISNLGEKVVFVRADVREKIKLSVVGDVSLVANFAAVHREPGHEDFEYFDTNIKGAENVTEWASKVGCNNLVFTSSISPYGVSEATKDESTLPVPVTAYGSSKLVAEKIHKAWQVEDPTKRVLTIVRPGVVFGPGEGGNVTRLVKAVRGGYFFYMGNKQTRKAGIYVKELCNSICWVNSHQLKSGAGFALFNASMNPGPSISEYVDSVCRVAGIKRFVPSVPFFLLHAASYFINAFARPLSISHPFSPVRIRKLVRSNNVMPSVLESMGYEYVYDLDSAFSDWKEECPEEWGTA